MQSTKAETKLLGYLGLVAKIRHSENCIFVKDLLHNLAACCSVSTRWICYSKVFGHVKICQDMSRYVKICQDMSRYVKICHAAIYYSLCFLLLVLVILQYLCCRISISRELHNEGQKEIIPATSSYQDIFDLEAEKLLKPMETGLLKQYSSGLKILKTLHDLMHNEWSALMEFNGMQEEDDRSCKTMQNYLVQTGACLLTKWQFPFPI